MKCKRTKLWTLILIALQVTKGSKNNGTLYIKEEPGKAYRFEKTTLGTIENVNTIIECGAYCSATNECEAFYVTAFKVCQLYHQLNFIGSESSVADMIYVESTINELALRQLSDCKEFKIHLAVVFSLFFA